MALPPKCPDIPPCTMSVSDSVSLSTALKPIASINSSRIEIQADGTTIVSYTREEINHNGSWFHLNVPEKDAVGKLQSFINKKVKFVLIDEDAKGIPTETNYFEVTIERDKSRLERFLFGKY